MGLDGKTRKIRRTADTPRGAERALLTGMGQRSVSETTTLADLLNNWLDNHTGITEATRSRYSKEIRNYLVPRGGDIKLSHCSAAVLQNLIDRIGGEVSRDAARHSKGRLGQAFRWGLRMQLVDTNPMPSVEIPRAPRFRAKAPTDKQVRLLRRTLEKYIEMGGGRSGPKPDDPLLAFELMAGTGARIGEVCALKWEDVDFKNSTITFKDTLVTENNRQVLRGRLKNHDPYRVSHAPKSLMELLKEKRRKAGPVLRSRENTHIQPNNIRRTWRAAYDLAEIPDEERITPHDLRRAVGTRIAHQMGVEAAAGQLGDTIAVAEKHYIQPTYTGPKEAGKVLEQLF